MVVLRLLLVAALALPGAGLLAGRPALVAAPTAGAAPAVTVANPATAPGQEAVLDEVAVAVAPVVDGEAGQVAPAEGSGSPDLRVTADSVTGATVTTDVVESAGFGVVGLTWPDGADVDVLRPQVRVRTAEGWSEWVDVEIADDGPDAGTPDAAGAREGSDPVVVGDADAVQARFAATAEGGPEGLALALVDPDRPADTVDAGPAVSRDEPDETPHVVAVPDEAASEPAAAAAAAFQRPASRATRLPGAVTAVPALAPRPAVLTRAQWGADESLRAVNAGCETPSYASTLVGAAIHHTASSNAYSSQAAAMSAIRGIHAYHVLGRGWCDIGYNFLVDKWGTIYEGRSGGMDRAVIGVHAGGFNTRTVGISLLGDYSAVVPSAAMRESVARIVAWRLGAYHRDPTGSMTYYTYGGENSKIPANTSISLPVVFPHRQVAFTSCPGDGGMQVLSWIRSRARQLIGTSLVGPALTAQEVGVGVGVDLWSGAWGSVDWHLTMTDRYGDSVWDASGSVTNGAIHARWSGRSPYYEDPYPEGTYDLTLAATDRATGATLPPFRTTLVVAAPVNPFGRLDAVQVAPGRVEASGWAIDPDTSDPIIVQVFVDGASYTMGWANAARPDVGAAYPSAGPHHGFTLGLAASAGTRTVCAYAVNVGRGSSQRIGCRQVVVPSASPFGQIDRVAASAGRVTASGWVIDPDAGGPSIVQMWLDGRAYTMAWASRSRPDVAAAYPWAGAEHGYELSLPASRGTHTVCVPAVNAGQGSNVSLGCRRVTVP